MKIPKIKPMTAKERAEHTQMLKIMGLGRVLKISSNKPFDIEKFKESMKLTDKVKPTIV